MKPTGLFHPRDAAAGERSDVRVRRFRPKSTGKLLGLEACGITTAQKIVE
jgi:hypothetical protein